MIGKDCMDFIQSELLQFALHTTQNLVSCVGEYIVFSVTCENL